MAGASSRARGSEQEHGPAGDERHLAEPSDDSRAHLGAAADAPEADDAASSGNPSARFGAVFKESTKRLELVSEPDRITRPEDKAATRQSQRLGLRRAKTLGCIDPRATQKTSRFPRSLSDTAEKTGEGSRRKKGANTRRNDAEQLATEGAGTHDTTLLLTNGTDSASDAAMSPATNEGPRTPDPPQQHPTEQLCDNTGDEMTDGAFESLVDGTLATVHFHTPAELWTSANKAVTVDLPLVAKLVGCGSNPNQVSASTVLDAIRKKKSWNLGTMGMILRRFAAESVPLLHRAVSLLQLKGRLCAILMEWMNETPPLGQKQLQYPAYWPLDHPDVEVHRAAPSITRAWAARLLDLSEENANAIPQPTRQALRLYSSLPLCHLICRAASNQPAPPESPPTRPMPRPTTARAERRGTRDRQEGGRARTSDGTPNFTTLTTQWYESARCTVGFIGSISGEVRFSTTLDNLRKLLDAGPRTDLAGLRRIATERRKQLDPEKVDRILRPATKAQKQRTTPAC